MTCFDPLWSLFYFMASLFMHVFCICLLSSNQGPTCLPSWSQTGVESCYFNSNCDWGTFSQNLQKQHHLEWLHYQLPDFSLIKEREREWETQFLFCVRPSCSLLAGICICLLSLNQGPTHLPSWSQSGVESCYFNSNCDWGKFSQKGLWGQDGAMLDGDHLVLQ